MLPHSEISFPENKSESVCLTWNNSDVTEMAFQLAGKGEIWEKLGRHSF